MNPITNRRTLLSLSLLALLALAFLWRVTFNGDILLPADMLLLYEPWRSELPGATAVPIWNEKTADSLRDIYSVALYIKETWRHGEIPFWYPYAGLGLPIVARLMNQVLYPVNNILWQLMEVPESFGWSAILHLFLAGVFSFFYLRELRVGYFGSLVAAITFSYSSIPMTWLSLPFFFDTMIWLPLLFLGLERAIARRNWRWSLLGAAGLALQILAGSLQLVSYGLTALWLYALAQSILIWRQHGSWRQGLSPTLYAGLITGLGSGLVAFQILSTVELVQAGITRSEIALNPHLPLRSLARLLIPDIFGTPLDGNNFSTLEFEVYLYLGVLPLFFLVASFFSSRAATARSLFGIGLLFLLVIYSVPPFYQIFYYLYPAFPALGFHRSLYALMFVWAAAAGIGADYLLSAQPQSLLKWLGRGGLIIGLIVLVVTLRLAFLAKYQERFFWQLPNIPDVIPNFLYYFSTLVLFLVLFSALLLLLWFWSVGKISAQSFAVASLTLLVLDLFLAHLDFTPALPRHMLNVSPPSLTFLQNLVAEATEPIRISGAGNMLRSDTGGAYGIPSLQVHDPYLSRRFSAYADLTGLRRGGTFRDVVFSSIAQPLLNALNAKYFYVSRQELAKEEEWFSVLQEFGQPQVESAHPEAGQVKYWTLDNWTQPVLYAPADTRLSYQASLPEQVVLETALAIDPQNAPQDDLIFEIFVSEVGQTAPTLLFSYRLEQQAQSDWQPIVVDLAQFAGKTIEVSLATRSEQGLAVPGGWADPLLIDGSKYEQVYYGVNSIYKNKNYLPRAWVVHQITQVATAAEAEIALGAVDFNPATTAVIEGQLPASVQPSNTLVTPRFVEYRPAYAKIEVELAAPGLLVLSDLYYPGWTALVDGLAQQIYPTNLTMRGVYVPAGFHQIEFLYVPTSFRVGLYISLTTLLIIAAVLVLDWRKQESAWYRQWRIPMQLILFIGACSAWVFRLGRSDATNPADCSDFSPPGNGGRNPIFG